MTFIKNIQGARITGSITASFTGDGSGLTGIISASHADTASYVDLVAGTNITINQVGTSFEISSSAGGGASSGIFGISDSSGTYTYYATLTLAMASAVSGDTIEMFADVTESTAVTITLKDGVNINGNGHTYTYTYATGNSFNDNGVAVNCQINNLNIVRNNYTSGAVYNQTSTSSDTNWKYKC
jgi:outer membrane lipoprotein SlyB